MKPAKSEHGIQNEIRNAAVDEALMFRANVGTGWQGVAEKPLPDGSVILRKPRRFSTGLPTGFSDLFGLVPVTVTPDMVGKTVGVFVAVEVKNATGRARDAQRDFIDAVRRHGGRAGLARSIAEALEIIRGER